MLGEGVRTACEPGRVSQLTRYHLLIHSLLLFSIKIVVDGVVPAVVLLLLLVVVVPNIILLFSV